VSLVETQLQKPHGLLVTPDPGDGGTGVLILSGSSGRVEEQRARLLAAHGVTALSIQWWGDEGQPPGICELPLETFISALDRLAQTCGRVVVIGSSYGAVASLLVGVHDRRVDAVVAFAPSHVVWANVGAGHDGQLQPCRSMFTLAGEPIPFVPHDDSWEPDCDPPAYRVAICRACGRMPTTLRQRSSRSRRSAATSFSSLAGTTRSGPVSLVTHPEAGHRTVLPGEAPVQGGQQMLRGGSPEADAQLGAMAWPEILHALRLG
jgi:pimeloyl-ACP methyl ester carboxylesterase